MGGGVTQEQDLKLCYFGPVGFIKGDQPHVDPTPQT